MLYIDRQLADLTSNNLATMEIKRRNYFPNYFSVHRLQKVQAQDVAAKDERENFQQFKYSREYLLK